MNSRKSDGGPQFEVIVIGGGITGLAIARACESAGFSAALIEKGEFGQATSANSLRIIHGGFRYLQSLNIPRVVRSLRDQARVLREFPHLVRPLPCYLPLKKFGMKSRWPLMAATLLYRFLGWVSGVRAPAAGVLTRAQAEEALPLLAGRVPHGAFLWHDLQLINPHELHAELAQQTEFLGGRLFPQTEVTGIERLEDSFSLSLSHGGEKRVLTSRIVVNAAGPHVQSLSLQGESPLFSGVGWCRGFNLVFEGNPAGVFGAGLSSEQGRLYFIVGRDGETAVGTDYLECRQSPDQAQVSESEIKDFINRVGQVAPDLDLTRDRLKRIELGVLPLESSSSHPESGLIGSARFDDNNGFISVLSTKYTTFLSQADLITSMVARYLRQR